MVLFRGSNNVGPANRDEKGAYEEMEQRIFKYMSMPDDEWNELYKKMYNDRKYPGHDNLKLVLVPSLIYTGLGVTFSYELFMRRASAFSSVGNLAKVLLIPVFGVLTFRNLEVSLDIIRYRKRYPEMYQA